MARDNAIGTGAVVLTASADKLLTGLDRARRGTDRWAKGAGKGIGGQLRDGLRDGLGDGLGKSVKQAGEEFLEAPFKFAAVGAAVAVKDLAAGAFRSAMGFETAEGFAEKLGERLADGADATGRMIEGFARLREDALSKSLLPGIDARELGALGGRLSELTEERGKAAAVGARADGLNALARAALKGGSLLDLTPSAGEISKIAAEGVKGLDKQISEVEKRVEDLKKAYYRAFNPDIDPAKVRAVEEMTQAIDRESYALRMGADAARLYQMKLDGFSEGQIARVKGSLDALAGANEEKNFRDLESALTKQVILLREGEEAAERYQRRLDGMAEGRIAQLEAAAKEVTFARADRQLIDMEKALGRQRALWGAAREEVERYDLAAAGATADQLARLGQFQQQRAGLESVGAGLAVAAQVMFGGMGKVFGEVKELSALKADLAGAFGAGSEGAYAIEARSAAANLLAGRAPGADGPAKVAAQQLAEARKHTGLLRQIAPGARGSVVIRPTDL